MPTLRAYNRIDPSKTLTLRKRFERDLGARFQTLVSEIRNAIVDLDVFGLRAMQLAERQFQFDTDGDKMRSFIRWLNQQVNQRVLEVQVVDGIERPLRREKWTNMYVRTAYRKGIEHARQEVNRRIRDTFDTDDRAIDSAFDRPIHADRIAPLYERTFSDLQGATTEMTSQVRRTLLQGLTDGKHPRDIATELNNRVKKIGKTRARTIARTEIIRAHHQANINEYESAGVAGVNVVAEWLTVGDGSVCAECEDMAANGPYSLDDIRSMIPLHPNCRCVAVPADISVET